MKKTLLLLTHQFPYDWGDAAFVRHEIGALSAEFDEVRIVSLWGGEPPLLPLPPNCVHLGSIGQITPAAAIRGLLSWRRLRILAAETTNAIRLGVFRPAPDLRAMLAGMAMSRRLDELNARKKRSEALTIYSFWGVDVAYSVPWFAREADSVAVRIHRYDFDEESDGYRPIRPAVLGRTHALLTISEAATQYAHERYRRFLHPDRVQMRRLGVPGSRTSPRQKQSAVGAQITSASSMIPRKRVDLILEAVAEIARRGRTVSWTHFGDGPESAAIQSRADLLAASLPTLSVVFAGRVAVQQIQDHYEDSPADVFLNLSTQEGVPVSIMEAASFDIPSVATDVGATRELVGTDLGTGVLVPMDATIGAIADAIEAVLDHPEQFHARDTWAEHFDATQNARATAAAIADLSRD